MTHLKKNIVSVKLKGGLGNQMFQYATAYILALKNDAEIFLDKSFFINTHKKPGLTPRTFELSIFSNTYTQASPLLINKFFHLSVFDRIKKKLGLNYPKIYSEPGPGYYSETLSLETPLYLNGYFQSYKYFKGYEMEIREIFSFPLYKLGNSNMALLTKIRNTESISIHIRRGDYVNDSITKNYHGQCGELYYKEAIDYICSKIENPYFYFFSDDCAWVKEEFQNLSYSKTFVDHNMGKDSWKDMCLMSNCKHNIIANSSFSWWGAWLNNYRKNIVIAPEKWLSKPHILSIHDLIPDSWKLI